MTSDHVDDDTERDAMPRMGGGGASDDLSPTISLFCVHGIGVQANGQTAREVRESVRLALTELGGTYRQSAESSAPELPVALEDRVDVAGMRFRLRYRDGWWDERAAIAPAHRVLGWLFRVVPFALWGTATLWATDLDSIESANPDRRKDLPLPLVAFAGLSLAMVGAPALMLIGLPILSILLLLRPSRSFARRILERYVGDAWSYRSDRLDEDVIDPLRNDVAAERRAADVIMLVGHSQGAEIARRIALIEPVDGCVWVGSGEAQLGMLRTLRRSRLLPYLLWTFALVFPALFAWSLIESFRSVVPVISIFLDLLTHPSATTAQVAAVFGKAADALLASVWPLTLPALATGAVTLVMSMATASAARHPVDASQQPNSIVMMVKSLIDPVCFGTLNRDALIRYVPLPAKRFWLRQHLTYFRSPETGVAILETLFGTEAIGVTPSVPVLGKRSAVIGACCAVFAGSVIFGCGLVELRVLGTLL